jgi:tRNA modification GTPase
MIEALGMERTSEKISSSDLVIFVVDGSAAFDGNDRKISKTVTNVQAITVINKSDLPQITDTSQFPKHMHALKPLHVSAKCGTGIGALKDMIVRRVRSGVQCSHNGIVLTNERHKDALMRCRDSLLRFQDAAGKHAPSELAAVDLHEALNMLGEITGECVPDDVLDSVFSRFCIGK